MNTAVIGTLGYVYPTTSWADLQAFEDKMAMSALRDQVRSSDMVERITELRSLIPHLEKKSRTKLEDVFLGLYKKELEKLTDQSQSVSRRQPWISAYARKRKDAERCITDGNAYNVGTEQCSVYANGRTNTNFPTPIVTEEPEKKGLFDKLKEGIKDVIAPKPVTEKNEPTFTTTSTGTSKAMQIDESKITDIQPITDEAFFQKYKMELMVVGGVVLLGVLIGSTLYFTGKKRKIDTKGGGKK
ncbi:hypothetical protein [Bernardetia sp.]|uniref:hypothetical protein n=1 Tax=Bernardetia sp. TaxID=1937974 RepID=UPI0025C4A278|nr:hypothetical protein [Bernardetia sp.]